MNAQNVGERARPVAGWLMCTCALARTSLACADSAIIADPNAPAIFSLGPGRTAGWQFSVDAPILLTGLGLYDWQGDGFQIDYPVAMWDEEGNLLTSTVIAKGIPAPTGDGFVYSSSEGAGVLMPGITYTIGYFASTIATDDLMISFNGFHTMHPMINQIGGPVITSDPGRLSMPDSAFEPFDQWFGPSFQFVAVPGPGGAAILALAVARFGRRRRA